jgi:hypothetical protein
MHMLVVYVKTRSSLVTLQCNVHLIVLQRPHCMSCTCQPRNQHTQYMYTVLLTPTVIYIFLLTLLTP